MTNQINKMMTGDSHIASKVMNVHFSLHLCLVLPSIAGRLPNNSIKKVMQISQYLEKTKQNVIYVFHGIFFFLIDFI